MFTFTVKPDGGEEYTLTATSRDVYVWEKTGRDRAVSALMNNLAMGSLYELAHIAARRQGMFAGTLTEFAEQVDLEFDDNQDEPDPTRPGPSTGR